MIVITSFSDEFFTLNGVNYAKIYQPLKQGVSGIGIYNIYDTRQQLVSSTSFGDFEINGAVYVTQEETIAALLSVVFSNDVSGLNISLEGKTNKGGYSGTAQDLKDEIDSKAFEGLVSYQTKALLDASVAPSEGTPSKVVNDSDASNNGYYSFVGGVWVKDLNLVEDLVEESNVFKAVNGKAIFDYRKTIKTLDTFGLIPLGDSFLKDVVFSVPSAGGSSGSGSAYGYSNEKFNISSEERLKGVHVYCTGSGFVTVDFMLISGDISTAQPCTFINNIALNVFPVVAGWNYIPVESIHVPFFDEEAYVSIRASAGLLKFTTQNNLPNGERAIEFNGNNNTGVASIYSHHFYIDKYDYDINYIAENNQNDIILPKGQINITSSLVIENRALRGQGVYNTFLKNKITSGERTCLKLGSYAEVSGFRLEGDAIGLDKNDITMLNTVTELENESFVGTNQDTGIKVEGVGCIIKDLIVEKFRAYGIVVSGQSRLVHSVFSNIQVYECYIGVNLLASGEYTVFTNLTSSNNILGLKVGAGNVFFSSCSFNDNKNGLHINDTGNNAHGTFSACNFNHSANYSLFLQSVNHGENFTGCHVFEGIIYLKNCKGVNYQGGTIDAPIQVEGGTTQMIQGTAFQDAYWNRLDGIGHNFNGSTSYLKMINNFFMFETGANDNILNN